MMRALFVDGIGLDYPPDALHSAPLGGSQSAMLIAAEELARSGVEVYVASPHLAQAATDQGVQCLNFDRLRQRRAPPVDIVVTLNHLLNPRELKDYFSRATRYIHWHQNDTESAYAGKFADPAFYAHVDDFVFVSHWQAGGYLARFGLRCDRAHVIHNPVSRPFVGVMPDGASILEHKDPDLLVYASAPNRGLENLIDAVLPRLRRVRPRLRLEIYSGFYLDQGLQYRSGGASRYEPLFAKCAATPGVTFHRGLPKAALAARFKAAAMLCYPCNYRETFCVVAAEAMAAGCLVNATTIGALPETTAGYAALTPFEAPAGYSTNAFTRNALDLMEQCGSAPRQVEQRLRRQIDYASRCYSPGTIGRLWLDLLAA